MFETSKEKAIAIGVGAVAGLALLGGVAFAQTPGAGSTQQAQPTATAPVDGSGGHQKDGKDCPHDQDGGASGSSTSYGGA